MNIILKIFIIESILTIVKGYTTVYQKTFDSQTNCFSGDSYIPGIFYQQNVATQVQCDVSCINPSTSNPLAMLVIGPNETGINLTISLANVSEPFSIVGVEVVYTTSADAKLGIDLNGWKSQEFNSPKPSKYIDNYNNFNCAPYQTEFYSSHIIQYSVQSYSGDLVIQLNKIASNLASSVIGIRSINVWTNCKLGCSTCSDQNTCTSCLIPYKPYKEPDWTNGQVYCLHNYGCEEASPGCNLCYYDEVSKYFCGLCQTQYSQNYYGYCVSNSCPSNQMFFDNKCVNKGNNCVVYNKNTNSLQDCDLTKIDINNYQCPEDKVTTIFEYNNYSQFICNCFFYGGYDCQKCLTKGSCSQCSSMKYYDSINKICQQFTCPDGSYATRSLKCLPCPSGCSKCTTTTNCTECTIAGYYFNGTQCVACPISKCAECNNNGLSCSQCMNGYKLQSGNTTCVKSCTITNCDVCFSDGTNFCNKCLPNYSLKSTNDSCVHCQTPDCQTCQQATLNQCDSCVEGNYYFISSNKTCIFCQVPNCTKCQSNDYTKCEICSPPYSLKLSNYKCVFSEVPNCFQSDKYNSLICTSCASGYTLNTTNFQCNTCNVTDCDECDANDPNKCIRCKKSYYIKGSTDFSCGKCPVQYCSACQESNLLECTTCYTNYYWFQSELKCKYCQVANCQNCKTSTAFECSVCNTNYVVNPIDFSCIPKCQVNNCSQCINNDTSKCQTCSNGFYLNNTTFQCVPCQVQNCDVCSLASQYQCDYCAVDYIQLGGGTSCQKCLINSCLQCSNSNPNICISCESGLLPNPISGKCEFCQVSGCKTCSNQSSLTCTECNDNYVLNNGECICNLQFCSQCDYLIEGKCLQCKNNYILDENYKCHLPCYVNNCSNCSNNDPNLCIQCLNNFQLNPNTGNCEQCQVSGCKTCLNQNSLQCSICFDNFILNNEGKCDCNLYACTQCDEGVFGKCLQCNNQAILDGNFNCQLKCEVNNCKICSLTDSNVCQFCMDQYYLDLENKCQLKNFNDERKINNFRFKQKLIDTGVQITILFYQQLIVVPKQSNNILKVEISDYNNFRYEIIEITDEYIIMNLIFSETVKLSTIKITLINQQFVTLNLIEKNVREEDLEPYIKLNQSQKDAISASTSVSNSVSMTIVSSFLPLAILGHFYVLVNTIDYTSFLYYLLFINIRHPENVVSFYGTFKNFQFPFIPNLFQYMIPDDYILESPKKFMEMETDAYFLRNGGQSITICLIIVTMYIGARILQKLPVLFLKIYFDRAIKETWHYGAFFDMLCTVYIYLLVSSLVQFLNFDFNDNTGNCILNYSLHFITTFLAITIPFAMFYFIYRLKNLKSNKDMQIKISTLVGGLSLYDESQQTPASAIQIENNNHAKTNKQIPQIQQKLNDYEQQNRILDQNDIQTLRINSYCNIKSPNNENVNQKETLHSEKNINQNQNDIYETNEKLNVNSNRNSIIIDPSFNNIQTRRKSITNQSKLQSSEQILLRRDKLDFIAQKQFSDSIFPPDYLMNQKTLREKLQIKYTKQYNSLLYIRKLFFSLIIVYFHNYSYAQLILISLLNIFISTFIFYIKPFEQNSENIKSGICEILLVCIHICLIFLIQDEKEQDEQVRLNVGWIIISISLIIILWNFIIIMYQLLCFLLSTLKRVILSISSSKSKVAPSTLQQNNDIQDKNNCNKNQNDDIQNQNKDEQLILNSQNKNEQFIQSSQNQQQEIEYDENEIQKELPFTNIQFGNNNQNQRSRKASQFSSSNALNGTQKNTKSQGSSSTPSPEPQKQLQKRSIQKNSLFKRNKLSKVQRVLNDDTTIVNSSQNIQNDSKLNEQEFNTPNRIKSATESQIQIIYENKCD